MLVTRRPAACFQVAFATSDASELLGSRTSALRTGEYPLHFAACLCRFEAAAYLAVRANSDHAHGSSLPQATRRDPRAYSSPASDAPQKHGALVSDRDTHGNTALHMVRPGPPSHMFAAGLRQVLLVALCSECSLHFSL